METYRIYEDGGAYFVTMSVVEWLPVFVAAAPCLVAAESLNFCHQTKGLRVMAYVIMPTHLHAVVFDQNYRASNLKTALEAFRKFTGRRLSDYSDQKLPAFYRATLRDAAGDDRSRRFWQSTIHAEQIATESFCQTKMDYIHENPCRKGLVRRSRDWRFSSASFWESNGQVLNDVTLTPIVW
jgi:putative transposase